MEPKRQRKRKLWKKGLLRLIAILLVFIIGSVIIQSKFMPEWTDGNTQNTQPAENGLHEQLSGSDSEN
jgi:hypothetical protein